MILTIQDTQPLPVGEYLVRLTELTEVEGKFGTQLRFRLEVVEGKHAGRLLTAFASPSGNPASKCVRWVSALLGRHLQAGEQVDLTTLVGKLARAVVVLKTTADGREVNVVQELLPMRRPSPPPEEPEEVLL